MKRSSAKKTVERRKKPRASSAKPATVRLRKVTRSSANAGTHIDDVQRSPKTAPGPTVNPDSCFHCGTKLQRDDRALFVEEEVGRIFCTEKCIAAFFSPEIERLEKEYLRRFSPNDLSSEEREELSHLRWITLQEPDEVWREKTITGDLRYTLISEYQPGSHRVWSVCICLFLRGEPSFLYLAVVTRNAALVNQYRKGERVQWVRNEDSSHPAETMSLSQSMSDSASEEGGEQPVQGKKVNLGDRLAEPWTADETFLAEANSQRREDDIPADDFGLYQSCLEETLEMPDEVWSVRLGGEDAAKLYHFIRYYGDKNPGVWFLIVARETENEEEIEILDAFPTRDSSLIDRYRRGEQEVGSAPSGPAARVIH